jgi:hypothetical protein
MRLVKKRVTPAVLNANRANSEKSTGPRTESGKKRVGRNAGKHYVFGQLTRDRMLDIGEEPGEFDKLHQSLIASFQPQDEFEEILAGEMAMNRWRLMRLRRAETGMVVAARGGPTHPAVSRKLMAAATDGRGLVFEPNSKKKFGDIFELLTLLYIEVEKEGFNVMGRRFLRAVYGDHPPPVGQTLIRQFEMALKLSTSSPGTDTVARPADLEVSVSQNWNDLRAKFLFDIKQEIAATRGELDLLEEVGDVYVSTYSSDMAFLTIPQESIERIIRYETMLQRKFESTLNLLLNWRNRRGGRTGNNS